MRALHWGSRRRKSRLEGLTVRGGRWRVQFMEESIKLLDFETIDQFLQIHDYAGVSMMSRDANQKAAASEATNIFQNHYPEFLVCCGPVCPSNVTDHGRHIGVEVLRQRADVHGVDVLGI